MCSIPTESRTVSWVHAGGGELLVVQLRVRRRRVVDRERLRVADVREMAEQLEALDETPAGLAAALDPEGDEAAVAAARGSGSPPRVYGLDSSPG